MADVTIRASDNGPYVVIGAVRVVDAAGREVDVEEPVLLCRCGRSGRKPFCDGSHVTGGFESVVRAGEAE